MAPTCREKKTRKSLTLNTKLEIITLRDQGMSNADIGRKLGLARQTISTVMKSKEKYIKEVKSATPANTKVIRKRDSLIADMEKLLLVWMEEQTSRNLPVSHSIIQRQALTLFNAMKVERGEEAAEEKFKASRGWLCRFKGRSRLHNIEMQEEAPSADVEADDAYPGLKVNKRRLKPGVLPSLNIPSWRIETPSNDELENQCDEPGSEYMVAATRPDSDFKCSVQSRHSSDDELAATDTHFIDFPVDTEYADRRSSGSPASNSSSDLRNAEDPESKPFQRRKFQSEEHQELIVMMTQLKEEIIKRSAPHPLTSDQYYCFSLSKRLSKLSACDNSFARMRIEQVLFELECGDS